MGSKARVAPPAVPSVPSPPAATEELFSPSFLLVSFAFFKLFLHVFTNALGGYGYFRDEFYYLACSENLAWGYVDHPPLSIVVLAVSRLFLGDSLVALRLLPALAGAASVYVTGMMVRELGGNRFAISLACLSVIIAPVYLALSGFYSMNSFDLLFWTLLLYLLLVLLKHRKQELWILFGLVAGFGLMNKISVLFLGFGIAVGLLLTPERTAFRTRWIWAGGVVAALIALPNVFWQMANDWPTREFIQRAQQFKIAAVGPMEFFTSQIEMLHPLTFPIWFAGLWFFFFHPNGRQYRAAGWMYIAVFILLVSQRSKAYYLAPIYPLLLAAGSVLIQRWIEAKGWRGIKTGIITTLVIGGIATAPITLPVLPVETFVRYMKTIGIEPKAEENNPLGVLPQLYADCFGWEELTATVVTIHRGLSPEEQQQSIIYAQNYGEAGAISFFGRHFGLPKAVSGHNNYFLWGPGTDSALAIIIIGGALEDHLQVLESVEEVARTSCTYCMPYENNLPIFVGRGFKEPIESIWPRTKHYN